MINELDAVILTHDIQQHDLKKGDMGAVVQRYSDNAFEVEFVLPSGETHALLRLNADDIRPLQEQGILNIRQVTEAQTTTLIDRNESVAKSLINLSQSALSHIAPIPVPLTTGNHYKLVLCFFAARGLETIRAIQLLVDHSLSEQGLTLANVLVEMAITTAYISKNKHERARLFIDYDIVLQKQWLDKFKAHDSISEEKAQRRAQEIQFIYSEYKKISHEYPDITSWSNKSLRQMAEECGDSARWYYDMIHAYLNESSHNSIRRLSDYFNKTANDTLQVNMEPNTKYNKMALFIACTNYLIILSHFSDEFSLNLEDDLKQFLDYLDTKPEQYKGSVDRMLEQLPKLRVSIIEGGLLSDRLAKLAS